MKSKELSIGRTFGVTFEHEADFFEELSLFCKENQVKQGYIPMFIAGFSEVELVGSCGKINNPNAPVWDKVYLENVEACGCGTIAYDSQKDMISPHIHVSTGIKSYSASAHTSHLLSAKVLFLVEMVVVEVLQPEIKRVVDPNMYNIGLLQFL